MFEEFEFVTSFMCRKTESLVFVEKLKAGVYCIHIKGTDFIFQTYFGMFECIFELLDNDFYVVSNTSPVIEKMIEQWERQIFVTDKKAIERIQYWFEEE